MVTGHMATMDRIVGLVKTPLVIVVYMLVSYLPRFGCSVGAQREVGFVQTAPESKSYRAPAETPAEASVGLAEPWPPCCAVCCLG